MNSFNGTNIKRLGHFISPNVVDERPNIDLINIEYNDITHTTVDQIVRKDIMNRLVNVGKKCLSYSVKEMMILSIFMKKQFKLTRTIRRINDLLHDECKRNNVHFISNDNITREALWRAGLHLNNDNTYIFASNLLEF